MLFSTDLGLAVPELILAGGALTLLVVGAFSPKNAPLVGWAGVLVLIAAATGVQGMVGGQYMDVAGDAAADDDLRTLHALKTGRLIQAAVA